MYDVCASMSMCGNFMCIVCIWALFVHGHVFVYLNIIVSCFFFHLTRNNETVLAP